MICEYPCNWFDSDFEKYLASGDIIKADTIEELAEKLEFPSDKLKKMVDRYNEMCHNGHDEDFFKPAQYLIPIETPPFYAVKQEGSSCFSCHSEHGTSQVACNECHTNECHWLVP